MIFHRIFSGFYEKAGRRMCRQCDDFVKKGAKILDLGCGSGIVGKTFQDFFQADLMGADIKDQRITRIPFKITDGRNLPFSDNSFDIVLINYVLHHAKDPVFILNEAKRVADNKIIVFEDLPEGFFADLICSLHGFSYKLFFQKDGQGWKFLDNKAWEKMFENLGLRIIFEKRVSHVLNPVKKKMFILEKS